MTVGTNYFVCTLGEAACEPNRRPYSDVNDLLERQAQAHADLPAIGFCKADSLDSRSSFDYEILSFGQVQQGILVVAHLLSELIDAEEANTVGLLCTSSPEFLFTWLACIRLGLSVLLIAPECSPSGITHLCHSTGVKYVFRDGKHAQLCEAAAKHESNGDTHAIRGIPLPFSGSDAFRTIKQATPIRIKTPEIVASDVAYFHHTSGTSSGLPKPIPQTHRGAVGVLPALDGSKNASITTTPLYHGGPADIFRAWTSNAMVWLYPSKDIPISASNVVKYLATAKYAASRHESPPVSYFATVPYILTLLLQDEAAVDWLRGMAAVSVGGAALPTDTGDELVKNGVNLVSRFGSAECGFLLSSHRDYDHDADWQYLRRPKDCIDIRMEPREDGLSELVVLSKWPHLAKSNRDDGSYATADLFEPHESLDNAWRYHSRADSQLTLVTGKKFDPAPLEDSVVAASDLIADALVFGNGKPYPGILLFRSRGGRSMSDQAIIQELAPVLAKFGSDSQAHTRIGAQMLVPLPFSADALDKSSKGTILRGRAEERYKEVIEAAYSQSRSSKWHDCADDQLEVAVRDIILSAAPTLSSDICSSSDLFSAGVDSVASMQIRQSLAQLLPYKCPGLSRSIIEECGSIEAIANTILNLRHGKEQSDQPSAAMDRQNMLRLVEKYGRFSDQNTALSTSGINDANEKLETVLLTGATGSLGAHVLTILRESQHVEKIICLVRGSDEMAARERLDKALASRHLKPLNSDEQVEILTASLGQEHFGLDAAVYNRLAQRTTIIMHLAWSVNFRMKLASFKHDNIAGVHNLLALAMASPSPKSPRIAFCSSVASAIHYSEPNVPERLLPDPAAATNLGYSQSKWVAEQICHRAAETTRLRGRVTVYRVGQLSGDSTRGVWNAKEAWPLMLGSVKLTGMLPRLSGEVLDWLPVDIAAAAMVQGALRTQEDSDMPIYHVVNDHQHPSWDALLQWMHSFAEFKEVEPSEWVQCLQKQSEQGSHHPALQLLEHWTAAYGDAAQEVPARKKFLTAATKDALLVMRDVHPVNEEYFGTLWRWIDENVK